jgi:uncharacterized membrane protein SirB2
MGKNLVYVLYCCELDMNCVLLLVINEYWKSSRLLEILPSLVDARLLFGCWLVTIKLLSSVDSFVMDNLLATYWSIFLFATS